MFNINDRFDFFDEPIKMFSDTGIDFYFEKDRRNFDDKKTINPFEVKQVKYKNFYEEYTITETRNLQLIDFYNNTEWEEKSGILQNKDIGDSQTATLEGIFNNVIDVTFDCKVSSESGYDYLSIYINGEQKIHISGEVDWQTHTYTINGDLDFKVVYSKDSSASRGADTGYLRNIVITQRKTVLPQPFTFSIQRNYKNNIFLNVFSLKNYANLKNTNLIEIRNYANLKNFIFERISFMQIPPKRVIIRDFNE